MGFPKELDTDTELYHETKDSETTVAIHHNALKDAIKALEEKVGVDGSSIPTSLDYKKVNSSPPSGFTRVQNIYLAEDEGELILLTQEA